jgi:lactoylglutathione lyase
MKFSRIVIKVNDYRRSFEFYKDILGLKLSSSWQRKDSWGAIFSAGGGDLEIIWFPGGEELEDCRYYLERKKVDICFEIHDIDILYKRLSDQGIEIIKEPFDAPWGYRIFSIKDPDGVPVLFMQPLQQ